MKILTLLTLMAAAYFVARLRSIRLRIELFLILSAVMFRDLLPRLIDVVEGRFWFRFTRQYDREDRRLTRDRSQSLKNY